ncbi:DEAD/DEAH box helicase family protein [Gammaproteobacteria bacterium]|nr:DEAD/DEAH box helicase family protein [Gammaproteobacteria bacterium]
MSSIRNFLMSCISWNDFHKKLSSTDLTTKFKGDAFEELTRVLLLTLPQYKTKVKNVWNINNIPLGISESLDLPSTDEGIDLIVETLQGGFWSVQCKFRSDINQTITYDDLATFSHLSFVKSKKISLGLVFHTSERPIKKKDLLNNISEFNLYDLNALQEEDWLRVMQLLNNKKIEYSKKNPRDYQETAILNITDALLNTSRTKLSMPCGTGKSLVAVWSAQKIEARTIIVAVPSLALIKQTMKDWLNEYLSITSSIDWLCICSDESVGDVSNDEILSDIYELGIPTTTNSEQIKEFLYCESDYKIIFCTYQSSKKLSSAASSINFVFDLLIADEAHKTTGLDDGLFATLLFDKNIHIEKRVFMTATERIYKGNSDNVLSMDDKEIYGDISYKLSFKEAIDREIICDYKIITYIVNNDSAKKLIEENRYLQLQDLKDRVTATDLIVSVNALHDAFHKGHVSHAITFHSSIKKASLFMTVSNELSKKNETKISNYHISSQVNASKRSRVIEEFKTSDKSIITNARCLTEGVDIPAVDCVAFIDPKQSMVDIVQASGRAMRKFPGKKCGYIMVPLEISTDEDLDSKINMSAYRTIGKVIAVLSSQDERLVDEIKSIKSGTISQGSIINIESNLINPLKINIDEIKNAITSEIWEKSSRINFLNYKDAKEIVKDCGFKTQAEFKKAITNKSYEPFGIPKSPREYYIDKGWEGWGDFLGTINPGGRNKYAIENFGEVKKIVQAAKISSRADYQYKYKELHRGLVLAPERKFSSEWEGWKDFCGEHYAANKKGIVSYEEAKKWVHQKKISSSKNYRKLYATADIKLPLSPADVYRGLYSMDDFYYSPGSSIKGRFGFFLKYISAKEIVKNNNINTTTKYFKYAHKYNLNNDIRLPLDPPAFYKEWINWSNFLYQYIDKKNKTFATYKEAKEWTQKNGIRNFNEYFNKYKSSELSLPSHPEIAYKKTGEWISWAEFTNRININKKHSNKKELDTKKKY